MITISSMRVRGDEVFDPVIRQESIVGALQSLLKFELGFGGRVIAASAVALTTETIVLGSIDTTEFMGSEDEMLYLLTGATIFHTLCMANHDEDINRCVERAGGSALLLTAAGGGISELMAGRNYSDLTAAIAVCHLKQHPTDKVKELVATYQGDLLYEQLAHIVAS